MFYDANNDLHIYGGGIPTANTSSSSRVTTSPIQNNIWSWSSNTSSWSSSELTALRSRYAPTYALSAHAPEHHLFFYFNGILSNGSNASVFPNMIVMNTHTKDVRVVSTDGISPDTIRVGAILQYLPLMGTRGALVLFGGATKHNADIIDRWGTMVCI